MENLSNIELTKIRKFEKLFLFKFSFLDIEKLLKNEVLLHYKYYTLFSFFVFSLFSISTVFIFRYFDDSYSFSYQDPVLSFVFYLPIYFSIIINFWGWKSIFKILFLLLFHLIFWYLENFIYIFILTVFSFSISCFSILDLNLINKVLTRVKAF